MPLKNLFSIDVEEWFHLMEHPALPGPSEWDALPSRVETNFLRLLEMARELDIRGTCFFLGWAAKRYPHLVRSAVDANFEIASHGTYHCPVYKQRPGEFYEDILEARKICEDICGVPVNGYRAPAFSIIDRTPWAFEKLIDAGYKYDSSVFPASRDFGGLITDRLAPHIINTPSGSIIEFPISIANLLGKRLYFFGGGYLRLFPYGIVKLMAMKVIGENRPIILYIHPRDIDEDQPRFNLGVMRNFKSYVNLKKTETKLRNLFRDFEFTSYREWLENNEIKDESE